MQIGTVLTKQPGINEPRLVFHGAETQREREAFPIGVDDTSHADHWKHSLGWQIRPLFMSITQLTC